MSQEKRLHDIMMTTTKSDEVSSTSPNSDENIDGNVRSSTTSIKIGISQHSSGTNSEDFGLGFGTHNSEEKTDSIKKAKHPSLDASRLSVKSRVDSGTSLRSTLKKQQRSWVDPYEPAVQDTFYHKDLKQFRPNFDQVSMAMTQMDTLFDGDTINEDDENAAQLAEDAELAQADENVGKNKQPSKFGAWDGVFAGCILNIFGVIMFLRVGWIVGQAGIVQAIIIMLISSVVTFFTTLSMSAICTNGTILGGGAYYIISRALGPAIGGSVGFLFSIGNMVAVSMYLIGFAETLVENIGDPIITGDFVGDVRIWSNIILIFELILALVGLKYVIKAQLGLLVLIFITIICFFIGSFYQTSKNDNGEIAVYGVAGWTNGNFAENLGSGYDGYDFWGVLSIFFPAVTGIMAGANISGDLKNPSHDIPLGTLSAVSISTIVYCIMAVFIGAIASRDELISNYLVMADVCAFTEYIILIGIYAATLSSGIAALVGAPRILQAVAQDDVIPISAIRFFAVSDKEGNPIRGYFLSFTIAAGCNCIGELNFIAPLISEFFMIAYLMINFACFSLEISKSPGWRPSFTYFNKYTAFSGGMMCLIVMFLINWYYALAALSIAVGLYYYINWKDPEINWGNAQASRNYYAVYKSLLKLRKQKLHIKNWRPAILCLTQDPIKRPQLVLFCQTLKKAYGPMFFATIHTGDYRINIHKFRDAHNGGYLPKGFPGRAKGFYEVVLADNFRSGAQTLMQLVGMGSLRPNTLMIGWKKNWQRDDEDAITEYVQILRDALAMRLGVILCIGFRRVNWHPKQYVPPPTALEDEDAEYDENYQPSKILRDDIDNDDKERGPLIRSKTQDEMEMRETAAWAQSQGLSPIVDVWWLLDDGGLLMLLPHLMKLHKFWSHCRLRMNLVADKDDVTTDVAVIDNLIHKFRLPFQKPRIILVENSEPTKKTIKKFEKFSGMTIEQTPRKGVTRKWLRLSELLFEHSRYSGLIVVTLPLPDRKMPPKAYMAVLNCLSDQKRMPPTLIMRGNGESSLTFYSE